MALRRWYHKMKRLFSGAEPRNRKQLQLRDKDKNKDKWYLWAAIDIGNKEVLGVWIRARKVVLMLVFLRKVLKMCTDKPIVYVEGGLLVWVGIK